MAHAVEVDQIQIDLDSVTAGPHFDGDIIAGFGEVNITVWGCNSSEEYTYEWTYELDSEFNMNTEDISGLFAGNYNLRFDFIHPIAKTIQSELYLDEVSPSRKEIRLSTPPEFTTNADGSRTRVEFFNQDKTYIFYCASAWRSALATKAAMEMGLSPVVHLEGGFNKWRKQEGAIETIYKK